MKSTSRKQSRVYAVYVVGTDRNKQHVCVARLRSVKSVTRLLTDIAVAGVKAYATVDGCIYCSNWSDRPIETFDYCSYVAGYRVVQNDEACEIIQQAIIDNDLRLDREWFATQLPWHGLGIETDEALLRVSMLSESIRELQIGWDLQPVSAHDVW